jgi:hypothetical protein
MNKTSILIGSFLIFFAVCCKKGELSELKYPLSRDQKFTLYQCPSSCHAPVWKSIEFVIMHETADEEDLENYRMTISGEGYLYIGQYNKTIQLDSICFCDDFVSKNSTSIQIMLVDERKNEAFVWGTKNSYDLYNTKAVHIVLLEKMDWLGNRFKIEID